jgi:ribosomal protein S18 acetylase RimI-like enzyme
LLLLFRPTQDPSGADNLIAVHNACAQTDALLEDSAEEYRPTLEGYHHDLAKTNSQDWVIAELGGSVVGYGHTLWNWSERDGTQVYLHLGFVKPDYRNQGIGTQLLEKLEARCYKKARENNHLEYFEIAANASNTENAAQNLLRENGYITVFTMLDMQLNPNVAGIKDAEIPKPYILRSVLSEHHLAIWQSIGDAYDARDANDPRYSEVDRGWENYFKGDPSLWFVAWGPESHGIAAHVLRRINKAGVAEIFEVSVGVAHRRKGIARALLQRAIYALRSRGAKKIVLGTRLENPTQAWRLYESVGFRIVKQFPRWRKHK